ncbi:MAG: hypothetical protein ACRC7O_15715 [Fimbriiglobus sp.]
MSVFAYETRLNHNRRWALLEGSMHFERESSVFRSMEKIAARLEAIKVPYAVCGGMAMFLRGYRRFTEDVDLLVTRAGLALLHERLEGLGYVPPFQGSKHLRDTETGVKIEFLVTGEFPGDGKPKPVAFPDPALVSTEVDGVHCLTVAALVELKLASGMTNLLRVKDIGDVQELTKTLSLDESLAAELNPFVRDKYLEIVKLIRDNPVVPE